MNCQYTWMNGIETFIYFKKPNAPFNAFYKNSVLSYPNGKSKNHPTEKPLELFRELIKISSNEGDIVFDPCADSCTTAEASLFEQRKYICIDVLEKYCLYGKDRTEKWTRSFINDKEKNNRYLPVSKQKNCERVYI